MSAAQPPTAATRIDTTTSISRLEGVWLNVARAGWIALALFLLGVYLAGLPRSIQQALAISDETRAALQQLGLSESFPAYYLNAVDLILIVGCFTIAVLIFWRKSDDWVAMFVGALLMLTAMMYTNAPYQIDSGLAISFFAALGEIFQVTFFLIFPDGRFVPRWSYWLVLPLIVWRPVMWLLVYTPGLPNLQVPAERFGYVPQDTLDIVLFLSLIAAGIAAQVYRYRRVSTLTQRQQAKWLLYGTVVTVAVVGTYVIVVNTLATSSGFIVVAATRTMRQIALLIVPAAIAISITRYRLWDIDLIIKRSLVYGTLTALLVVVYFASVFLVQNVAQALTGEQQSPVALATSSLVIAALFNPARRRLQRLIDRRFYGITLEQILPSTAPGLPSAGRFQAGNIGPYSLLEPIGRGGMGEVYKGRHTQLNRPVAIKILPEQLAAQEAFRKRFEREAQTVAALKHPNIINVFDFAQIDNTYYMVMEYIEGQTLADYLQEVKCIPLEEVRRLAGEIASALDYAHEQGLVHRDVKPANVMLQPVTSPYPGSGEFRAVLMDFGIAKVTDVHTGLTKTGAMGTLDYMAPEQIMAAKEVDPHADIYALGVMLYQMLTGELPFSGDNPGTIVLAHLQQPAPDPRLLLPELPERAALALMQALAKEPAARQATARELAEALG